MMKFSFKGTADFILKKLKENALKNFENVCYEFELINNKTNKLLVKGEFFPDGENSIIAIGFIMRKLNDFQIIGKGKVEDYTLKFAQKETNENDNF